MTTEPVDISILKNASKFQECFYSQTSKLQNVKFYGIITSVTTTNEKHEYILQDHTNLSISVFQFFDMTGFEDNPKAEKLHSFVIVYGLIADLTELTIYANKIEVCPNINNYVSHLLEIQYRTSNRVCIKIENKEDDNDEDENVEGNEANLNTTVYYAIQKCTDDEGCSTQQLSEQLNISSENLNKSLNDMIINFGHQLLLQHF